MDTAESKEIVDIAREFFPQFSRPQIERFGSGHINHTYRLWFEETGLQAGFILQRINRDVFPHPEKVMENIEKICAHLQEKISSEGLPEPERRCLRVLPSSSGKSYLTDKKGDAWRVYPFIERSYCIEKVSSEKDAEQLGRSFGIFLRQLSDFDASSLHETIPRFHHTPSRLETFSAAVDNDLNNRASSCQEEIESALAFGEHAGKITDLLHSGTLPVRTTHNDSKISNLLFCENSKEALCVIDLDTCMPGSALYDFGDMVRAGVSLSSEDEEDLSLVRVEPKLLQALMKAYLSECGEILVPAEKENLLWGAKIIIFEQAIRFLGDHLNGDTYYQIQRPGHNLVRAKTQLKLLASLLEQEEAILNPRQ